MADGQEFRQRLVLVVEVLLLFFTCLSTAADVYLHEHNVSVEEEQTTKLWTKLFENYDRRIRPYFGTNRSVDVDISLGVVNFESVSETNLDFTVNVYLVQRWIDPRLRYTAPFELPPTSHLNNELWLPDLIFINSKMVTLHQMTLENRVVQIFSNGTVHLIQRLRLVLACAMDFTSFPFDEQLCPIEMESFEYTTKDLRFQFYEPLPIFVFEEDLKLSQFNLRGASLEDCSKDLKIGNVSCVRVKFFFHREFHYYLLHAFIPSIMLVMLSCVSFMIDLRSVAARVSLGITTILTMLTTTIGVQNDLPRVAHAKAIDVWFLVNFVYVLGALLEYALVHYIGIQLPSEKHLQESEIQGDPNCISPEAEETQSDRSPAASSPVLCINSAWFPSFLRSRLDKKFEDGQSHRDALNHYYRFIGITIDRCCRIIFPITYTLFVIIFFCVATPVLHEPEISSDEFKEFFNIL